MQQEEYFCHAFNKDGLVGIAFVDEAYPARAGFCVVRCRGSWWRRRLFLDQVRPLLAAAGPVGRGLPRAHRLQGSAPASALCNLRAFTSWQPMCKCAAGYNAPRSTMFTCQPVQVNKLLEDFVVLKGEAWRGATADAPDQGQQLLADALQKYQVRCTSCGSVASLRWGSCRQGR